MMNLKTRVFAVGFAGALALSMFAGTAFAAAPGAAVKNENANRNACWGMDRAYYASMGFFPDNMDTSSHSRATSVNSAPRGWPLTAIPTVSNVP